MKYSHRLMLVTPIALRLAFGSMLICAAVSKMLDADKFARQVATYDLVTTTAAAAIGTILPWIEFIFGTCLLSDVWKSGAWLGTCLLFVCFAFARASVLWRGMSINCGCGLIDETITPRSEVLTCAMLSVAIAGYVAALRSLRPESSTSSTLASAQASIQPKR